MTNTVNIHKLALALLDNANKDINIQQQIQTIVADFTKHTVLPHWEAMGDDMYNEVWESNHVLLDLITDIKESGKNEANKKRAIDDTVKRVGRACEAIDKALVDAKQPSPFRDSEDKLRKLTISKGTKNNPSVKVLFGKAKPDMTIEKHAANTLAWLDKQGLTVTAYKNMLDKLRDEADKAELAEAKKAA